MSVGRARIDKVVSKLYLARSEGKIIQSFTSSGWVDKNDNEILSYGNRVKPQTVEEAAADYVKIYSASGSLTGAFILGAKWQKDQDIENYIKGEHENEQYERDCNE